ncbi:type VII secretion protein EccB [Herbihabitans rhizosphaerae]|uniref:Type VII secretion protein EccB n=1 Tax=Herbihabitans rhizosphaerae TaxID=1872711 RepID=A0A4Q7KKI4_9PSEU|nr:type VII secretion protein EccB [Herbihabitans rhizosphaerae]RZS37138.1 type VII secretion protein EccB [Herbihabitans rhizosphaerae]
MAETPGKDAGGDRGPSTPTTKAQVQAYRFVLRRMQSALVRKDPILMHDPMRTHVRATVVGVCVAALGVLVFLIWGILAPKAGKPENGDIVVGKQSGQLYVVMEEQGRKVLVPTFNLASARLLLLAQAEKQSNESSPGGGGGGATTKVDAKDPKAVEDSSLADIPKLRKTGLVDGPTLLPKDDQRPSDNWAVCDKFIIDPTLRPEARPQNYETAVLAGVSTMGTELPEDKWLLVRADNNKTYLVYRKPLDQNQLFPSATAVRAEVNLSNPAVLGGLHLDAQEIARPRRITTGMLNAIPEVPALVPPKARGADQQATSPMNNMAAGTVFRVQQAGGEFRYYVAHSDGIEEIRQSTAELIRNAGSKASDMPTIPPSSMSSVSNRPDHIDDRAFPEKSDAGVLSQDEEPVACLSWSLQDNKPSTRVHVGKEVPGVPKNGKNEEMWVKVTTPSADGQKINYFYMQPGKAAVVRGSTSDKDMKVGPISLISDTGVKFGVPDGTVAQALGLEKQQPAPYEIIKLLPDGAASLNTRDVQQSFDTVPVQGGVFPTQPPAGQNGGK